MTSPIRTRQITAAHSDTDARRTLKDLVGGLAARMSPLRMIAVARQRRKLGELDAHLLRDIGLTRSQVEAEIARPFWDISTNRVKRH